MNNDFCAEVISSSLDGWLAQSWDWKIFPTFGSIVIIETKKRKLFAIVHQIYSGSNDDVRQPIAFRKTEKELLEEQPQIFEFLKTNFSCLMIGYCENNNIFQSLAPEPVQIHDFVRLAKREELIDFFQNSQYLQIIFSQANKILNIDELLIALLNYLKSSNILNQNYFENFIDHYTMINNNDYYKLRLFLQRIGN